MMFGQFFDEEPAEWADAPVAALRAMARTPRAQMAPNMLPVSRGTMRHSGFAPPPIMPETPEMEPIDELGSLFKQGVGLAKQFEQKDDFGERLRKIDALLKRRESKGVDASQYVAKASPRVYSPLDAPDTGEIDTTGVPANYFERNRGAESGGNDRAVNQITQASGRYQFLPATWRGIMKEAPHLGLTEEGIFDPAQQDAAMRYYTSKSVSALKPMLGRDPTGGELYALHLLGHAGGANLIANAGKALPDLISQDAIRANPWLKQFDSGVDLLRYLNRRFA